MVGTPFNEWFGEKGLRGDDGKPLIIYHGAKTPDSLTRFMPGGVAGARLTGDVYGVATYATTSPDEAAAYIGDGGAVFPLYVRGELLDVDGQLSGEQQRRLTAFANEHLLPSDKARFPMGRSRRRFADVDDARDFFESQRVNWKAFGDGMERAKPEVIESDPEFVIEYTDFDAEITIASGQDAFTLFRAVGWDNLPAAGFDGMVMNREGGARWVVMHRTDGNIKSAYNSGAFNPSNPDIRFSELVDDEVLDAEDQHADALVETGFWGRAGAGSVIVSRRTGRLLLPLRSEGVLEPGTWGTWGGAIDPDESPEVAARRELIEEAGLASDVSVEMIPLMVFESGNFRYHNFAAVVDDEFEPQLNWESVEGRWVNLADLPTPLHQGLHALMQDIESVKTIRAVATVAAPRFPAEFLQWMEGSVIVDEARKPLKVYHGSAAEEIDGFRVGGDFKHGHGKQMPAIYFTPLRESAKAYARTAVNAIDASSDAEGTVHEAYLSLKNPKRFVEVEAFATAKREKLIAAGHDGAVRFNDFGEVVEIAVFEASQVRLARDVEVGKNATKDSVCRAIAGIIQVAVDELPSGVVVTTAAEMEAELQARRKAAWDAWFAGSKVVNGAGEPLVVYHGTKADFSAFDFGRFGLTDGGWAGRGFYFAPDPAEASLYASFVGAQGDAGGNVMPVFLAAQNPLEWRLGTPESSFIQGKRNELGAEAFAAWVQSQGYDAVHITSPDIGRVKGEDQWVVFRAEQIKSAIGNRGTYSPLDPDIRNSLIEAAVMEPSAAFAQWFDGSKLVGNDGEPMVLYHGTSRDFSVFSPSESGTFGTGIYFANNRDSAKEFGDRIVEAYACLKNPWFVQADMDSEAAYKEEFDSPAVADVLALPCGRDLLEAAKRHPSGHFGEDLQNALVSLGHDGIVASYPDGSMEVVAFRSGQIKSATANRGTYDPSDPDIRHSLIDEGDVESVEAFGRWFGDSKVVDAQGRPLVAYHGTAHDFNAFDVTKFGATDDGYMGAGIYFTTDAGDASNYSAMSSDNKHEDSTEDFGEGIDGEPFAPDARVLPVYLSVRNPYRLPRGNSGTERMDVEQTREWTDRLKELGYDGVVNAAGNEWVVFRPEQIKSAIGNCGAYDPRDPDIRHSVAGPGARAQAWHDASTNTTVFLADRIPAGRETSVFLHEIVHRHGRAALPAERFGQLVDQVKAWGDRDGVERAIHDAAQRRVATARVTGAAADEELFAYAVEEAVARGVQPSAAAVQGSAQQWLQAVVESIQRIGEKLIGNDLQGLDGQDLVDLAYALAQLDSPEHAAGVRKALDEFSFEGSALLGQASHINCELRLPGVTGYVDAERGKFASIYEWSGDGSGRTTAALLALKAYSGGNVVVHDAGEPGSDSLRYWQLMRSRGHVQVLLDGLGEPIREVAENLPEMEI